MSILSREFLLVDGYNMIHAWQELKELVDISLESARQKLLDMLSNYKGSQKANIIVVFDAYLVKGNLGKIYRYHNISVVYTKEAETADHFIEKTVHRLPRHYKVSVATSDALEQLIISGNGAIRITAQELCQRVLTEAKEIRKKYIENKPPKNNLLADNIDKDALDFIEALRRQK